jgi:hypothetical protein
MVNRNVNRLCGSEVRMRHVRPEVLVSEPNGRSRLTLELSFLSLDAEMQPGK